MPELTGYSSPGLQRPTGLMIHAECSYSSHCMNHAVVLDWALTSCTTLVGQTGTLPHPESGCSAPLSEHSGLLVSISQEDSPALIRHLSTLRTASRLCCDVIPGHDVLHNADWADRYATPPRVWV